MKETSKSKAWWGDLEKAVLTGKGLDIGCGNDPVAPDVRRFEVEDGDANDITRYVHESFDYVFSSHCLEHMHDPRAALKEWWKLVRPGGHIFFSVPDEDLYEQGVFPSRFNADHKATFTLSKTQSWSPVSINVLDLARSLPQGKIVSLVLQDMGYDRSFMTHGLRRPGLLLGLLIKIYFRLKRVLGIRSEFLERIFVPYRAVDQTRNPGTLAQIRCIVRKEAAAPGDVG